MAVIGAGISVENGSAGELRWRGYPVATLGKWKRQKVRKSAKVGADVVAIKFAIAAWHPLYGAHQAPMYPPSHLALERQKPTKQKPWLARIWRIYTLVECTTEPTEGRALFISHPHAGEERR